MFMYARGAMPGSVSTINNRELRLAARPRGLPGPNVWQLTDEEVPEPDTAEMLVKISHISLDPAMRGWMDDVRSYIRPVALGEVMRAPAVGRVIASRHPGFAEGSWVTGLFGVRQYALSDGQGVRIVDPHLAPLPRYLGALGITGLTAYFGMLDIGRPRPGETVVVSGAAGAVGSIAGQIGRLLGARTVGIAGGGEKCQWLTDVLGFEEAVDYKLGNVRRALRGAAPDGIDVYFDNVGGRLLDDALAVLGVGGRIILCGAISQYNTGERVQGPANYLSLLVNRASMTGLIVFDYEDRYDEATDQLLAWLDAGALIAREHVVRGEIDAFPQLLLDLFAGASTGKLVLELV
jgi:NADPH-dependent curcumin reductase